MQGHLAETGRRPGAEAPRQPAAEPIEATEPC